MVFKHHNNNRKIQSKQRQFNCHNYKIFEKQTAAPQRDRHHLHESYIAFECQQRDSYQCKVIIVNNRNIIYIYIY